MEAQSVRAFVRVRPFTAKEVERQSVPPLRAVGAHILINADSIAAAEAAEAGGSSVALSSAMIASPSGPVPVSATERIDHDFAFDGVLWSVPAAQMGFSAEEAADPALVALMPPFATQERVFAEVGQPALDAVLKGFPVTIFAYGQTGSGKSHTIFGPGNDPGLSPRISTQLFAALDDARAEGCKFEVEVSCFEIYNEKVSDLLVARSLPARKKTPSRRRAGSVFGASERSFTMNTPRRSGTQADEESLASEGQDGGQTPRGAGDDIPVAILSDVSDEETSVPSEAAAQSTAPSGSPSTPRGNGKAKELRVRQHPDLGVYIEGLRKEQVFDALTLNTAIHQALNHRVTAATKMNDTSSRSHAVIQLCIDVRDEVRGRRRSAVLNLVDLAGSERISRTGAQGQQLSEAKSINLSLTTLRRVIDVIADTADAKEAAKGGKRVRTVPPFRESTLTWILMDSFGGSSMTMMLAAVSPHMDNLQDTISTLRYASKCKRIVNHVKANETRIAATLQAIQTEMERCRRAMKDMEKPDPGKEKEHDDARHHNDRRKKVANLFERLLNKKRTECDNEKKKYDEFSEEADLVINAYNQRIQDIVDFDAASMELEHVQRRLAELRTRNSIVARTVRGLSDDCQHESGDIAALLGVEEYATDKFKSIRRAAIRRQLIMAAMEIRDRAALDGQRDANAELRRSLEALHGEIAHLCDLISREQEEVRNVSQFERAKDEAAQRLGEAHADISRAIEGLRNETSALGKRLDATKAAGSAVDEEQKGLDAEQDTWRSLHELMRTDLQADIEKETRAQAEELTNLSDLAALHKQTKHSQIRSGDACVLLGERSRLERNRTADLQQAVADLTAEITSTTAEFAEAMDACEAIESQTQNTEDSTSRKAATVLVLHDALRSTEKLIRKKVFPDAEPVYCERVLAQIALDLDAAAALNPKEATRMSKTRAHRLTSAGI